MHNVLVDKELVFFIKRLRGFCDNDSVIRGKCLYLFLFVLRPMHQCINFTINGNSTNIIVL